ncbi:MAG: TolC family protein, partial [Gemmatimonadaceae bacterium]
MNRGYWLLAIGYWSCGLGLAVGLEAGTPACGSALVAQAVSQQPITLEQAVAIAREQGLDAAAARAARDAARFRNRSFYARQLPQLSIGGIVPSYNRSIIPVLQPDGSTLFRPQDQTNVDLTATLSQKLPVIGGDFFVTSSLARYAQTGDEPLQSWSSTPVSFGIRQDILRPNTLAWDRREQPLRQEAADRGYLEALENIAIDVTRLFFDLYAAQVNLANQTKNAAVNDTLYRLNQGRFEVGKIGENDLLQSELALVRARTALDGARLTHRRAGEALRIALNLPEGTPVEIAVTAEVPAFEADTAVAVAEALRNRAVMSQTELALVQARRGVTEARFGNWVGATVSASFGYNGTGTQRAQVYRNLQEARQFSLAIEMPLWQWGAHGAEVEAAKSEREGAEQLATQTAKEVAHEARFAALQLAQARRTLALSAKADSVAAKRYEVAYNRYGIGRITLDNLFIAQNEKDQAVNQY